MGAAFSEEPCSARQVGEIPASVLPHAHIPQPVLTVPGQSTYSSLQLLLAGPGGFRHHPTDTPQGT